MKQHPIGAAIAAATMLALGGGSLARPIRIEEDEDDIPRDRLINNPVGKRRNHQDFPLRPSNSAVVYVYTDSGKPISKRRKRRLRGKASSHE
jgi:hypothetical protein